MNAPARRRLGSACIVVGLLTIVVAVIWVLEVANGPGSGPKTFAERRSYNQTKVALHQSFPAGLLAGLAGLGLALVGGRLRREDGESGASPDTAPR